VDGKMLHKISKRKTKASDTKVLANNYAFKEYGLNPVEMAKAAKRIRKEIKAARARGELVQFTGDAKSLKFF
jgi:hypothetical protein